MTQLAAQPSHRYRLYGSVGSPYALKLRALMRYRRLAFDWVPATLDWYPEDLPRPPLCAAANRQIAGLSPRVVPAVFFPHDGSIRNESTTIALALEDMHRERPMLPRHPGAAFLVRLLEDMADEWLVKIAFLFRWGHAADAAHKSRIVTGEFLGGGYAADVYDRAARHFAERQQSRMPLVGATVDNAPLIVRSFERLLAAMGRMGEASTFLFGSAPTLADAGFFGQLQSLATDPTPFARMQVLAPDIFSYLQRMDDASGIDPAGDHALDTLPHLRDLLAIAADFYLPYLAANACALREGRALLSFAVDDLVFCQAPFRYHARCYETLRTGYRALSGPDRDAIADLVEATGAARFL